MGNPIGKGPGNKVPDSYVEQFQCAATIAKGYPVALSGATAVAALVVTYGTDSFIDGTVIEGSNLAATDTAIVIGVAKEAGVVGDWIDVVVKGYCDYVVTDGTVVEGGVLISISGTVGTADSILGDTGSWLSFGHALADDVGYVLAKAIIWGRV